MRMARLEAIHLSVCFIFACFLSVNARDIFTAYNHLKQLAAIELELYDTLDRYIDAEEERLKDLHRFAESVANSRKLNTEPIKEYAANPIRAYLLMKRFVHDWTSLEVKMRENQDGLLGHIDYYKNLLPSDIDLDGARQALVRIQETYQLPPSYITSGLQKTLTGDIQLSVVDVYKIGREAYLNQNFQTTKIWMEEARRILNGSATKDDITLADVLDHLSWSEYKLGNIPAAVNYTKDWIAEDPKNNRAKRNLLFLSQENEREMGQRSKMKKPKTKKKLKPHQRPQFDFRQFDWPTERENYKRLCRGDEMLTYEEKQNVSALKCSFYTAHPLLRIKPARMEQVFEKPPIYIFRSFASEAELEDLKHIAGPKLSRATVHNPVTGIIEYANYRISEFTWLEDEHGITVAEINARLEAVTDLNVKTAEGLQVQNYGMAGQYDPHFDFSRLKLEKSRSAPKEHEKKLIKTMGDGNRIATALLYMNEVEAGGATVFPYVGARLTPSKGDLVFWHNLMKSGDGDFSTRHAGCPIISGTKWVANKWFHEVGNEFRRPCGLSPDE